MSKKLISLFLTIVLFTTFILNSYTVAETIPEPDTSLNDIVHEGAEAAKKHYSGNWEDYIGDIETFAYGLIINQLSISYDVFSAYIDLSDGNSVYGIAYTDYTNCYVNEDETVCCFEAGFIPYNGEFPVSQEEFDSGLLITNMENLDSDVSYLWTFASEPIREHCVVYGQYMQYGVDDNGMMFYNASDYIKGVCDESIGSLYSYDEAKYLFDTDVGSYVNINGSTLFSQLDFKELEMEINRILETQDVDFSTVDIVSCANLSQQAIISYLLSLQQETFLGYNVPELVEAAGQLDPLECYRITSNGLVTLKLDEGPKASDLTKWLVGTGCIIIAATAMFASALLIECPPLSALSGAVAGTAIEIFMQVVISEKDVTNLDWRKVALGAAAGAVSGYIGPYLYASFGPTGLFLMDSAVDGLIGGIERAAESWMDGADAGQILLSFGGGAVLGFALSCGFKGIAKGLPKLFNKISPVIRKYTAKYLPKLTNKVSSFMTGLKGAVEPVKKQFGNTIQALKKKAESSMFYNKALAEKQLKRTLMNNVDELVDNSLKRLSKVDIVDADGNPITKQALKELAAEAKDNTVLAYFKKGDEMIEIVKDNSMVSIVFDSAKYQRVEIPGGLTENRSQNMIKAAEQIKDQWLKKTSRIPDSLSVAIENAGFDIETITPQKLVSIIQSSEWVIHENVDLITATLVPRTLHETVRHSGGVSLAKYAKSRIVKDFFDRLINTAATGTVIATQ